MTSQDFKCFDGCLGCLADDDSDSCVAVQRMSDVEESTAVEMQPARKDAENIFFKIFRENLYLGIPFGSYMEPYRVKSRITLGLTCPGNDSGNPK